MSLEGVNVALILLTLCLPLPQMSDMKKKLESEVGLVEGYEESKKKMSREVEALQMRIEQLLAENDKLGKSKKKLQSEVRHRQQLPTLAHSLPHYQCRFSAPVPSLFLA